MFKIIVLETIPFILAIVLSLVTAAEVCRTVSEDDHVEGRTVINEQDAWKSVRNETLLVPFYEFLCIILLR